MSHGEDQDCGETGVFLGPSGVWARLDRLARATLGMDAETFANEYAAGRLARTPIADDLAALLPYAEAPGSAR